MDIDIAPLLDVLPERVELGGIQQRNTREYGIETLSAMPGSRQSKLGCGADTVVGLDTGDALPGGLRVSRSKRKKGGDLSTAAPNIAGLAPSCYVRCSLRSAKAFALHALA
jgi:hypothetical protein